MKTKFGFEACLVAAMPATSSVNMLLALILNAISVRWCPVVADREEFHREGVNFDFHHQFMSPHLQLEYFHRLTSDKPMTHVVWMARSH